MGPFRRYRGASTFILAVCAFGVTKSAIAAGHFDQYVDPNYNAQIFAGPIGNEGCGAWTAAGNLLTHGSSVIYEYSLLNNGTHLGTAVHPLLTAHAVPGLDSVGAGITNGTDGFLYTVGSNGLQRVDPNNWSAPAVNMPNTVPTQGYSINALPNGKIVYSDSGSSSKVYLYDPATQVNSLIYNAPTLVDDIETGPGGEIALAGQGNGSIIIINSSGGVIKQFSTARNPDGLAFGDGPYGNSVYANNNDGSITRYDFGSPGYQGTVTAVDIALTKPGHHGYGDLATVGPDCAFYIGTFANFALHGNDAGIGTNWDDGTTNGENSIVRIGFNDLSGGAADCAFYSFVETYVPEPSSASLVLIGLASLFRRRRHRPIVGAQTR